MIYSTGKWTEAVARGARKKIRKCAVRPSLICDSDVFFVGSSREAVSG